MKLRYLVLTHPKKAKQPKFSELVAANMGSVAPWQSDVRELDAKEAAEIRDDPRNGLVLSMPFRLIEPVATQQTPGVSPDAEPQTWGLSAVKANSCNEKGHGVTVAVLDTGIDASHAAFPPGDRNNGVKLELRDFTVNPGGIEGQATDSHGHGTHCAGTIFGRDVDGVRIGVAPGIKRALIGKVLAGGQHSGSTEAIHNAILWAAGNGADVISMSLGIDYPGMVTGLEQDPHFPLPHEVAVSIALQGYAENVIMFHRLAGLLQSLRNSSDSAAPILVAAAGNESRRDKNARFKVGTAPPATSEGFISVTALGRTSSAKSPFQIASFANAGARLAAPGVDVRSAKLGGGLTSMDGTSMATPHVAGVAALWIERQFEDRRPRRWSDDVMANLTGSAVPGGLDREDVGSGLVQAPPVPA